MTIKSEFLVIKRKTKKTLHSRDQHRLILTICATKNKPVSRYIFSLLIFHTNLRIFHIASCFANLKLLSFGHGAVTGVEDTLDHTHRRQSCLSTQRSALTLFSRTRQFSVNLFMVSRGPVISRSFLPSLCSRPIQSHT